MGNISGKVYGAGSGIGLAAPLTIILMYIIRQAFGVDPPPEVDQAVTAVIGFLGAIWGGYLAPHTANNEQPPAPPVP